MQILGVRYPWRTRTMLCDRPEVHDPVPGHTEPIIPENDITGTRIGLEWACPPGDHR
jgi:hypothetical protein